MAYYLNCSTLYDNCGINLKIHIIICSYLFIQLIKSLFFNINYTIKII